MRVPPVTRAKSQQKRGPRPAPAGYGAMRIASMSERAITAQETTSRAVHFNPKRSILAPRLRETCHAPKIAAPVKAQDVPIASPRYERNRISTTPRTRFAQTVKAVTLTAALGRLRA
jgi:hypothetical protein